MSTLLSPDEVEIADYVTLADLTTIDACQMAVLTLGRDINRIEEQLAGDMAYDPDGNRLQWAERAESAIRFKKSLKQVVIEKMAALRRAEKMAAAETRAQTLVSQFRNDWPAQFDMSSVVAQERRPDLWREAHD